MESKNFNPLVFLASLGAGGIAIMPFVLFQYTLNHGAGLITRNQLWSNNFLGLSKFYYLSLEGIMIAFTLLHLLLTVYLVTKLVKWVGSKEQKELIENPLSNATILAPFISILMTLNVFIGPVRYFIPWMQTNFQAMFLPAMIFWSIIFIFLISLEIRLLGISFRKGFDIDKISFGWLLHPFALGMLSVVGTGIAAMSKNANIANLAAFMSLIAISMGLFLLGVKMVLIFRKHFSDKSLPEKQFLPSFLIVIPNLTLYGISLFRLGHFLESTKGFHLDSYFYIVIGIFFAFEIWYMLFGLNLLKDYFKNHHFKDFYLTQWGFICSLVAFVVLGAFAYNVVLTSPVLYWILAITLFITVGLYAELFIKHIKCSKSKKHSLNCEF